MSDYKACMTEAMKKIPKGISREERAAAFCVSAKLCSGKAKTAEEAVKLCAESKKEPKVPRARKGQAKLNPEAIARCIIEQVNRADTVTVVSMTEWVAGCISAKSQGKGPSTSYKRFMKDCVKSQGEPKNLYENGRFVRTCELQWKEVQKGNA